MSLDLAHQRDASNADRLLGRLMDLPFDGRIEVWQRMSRANRADLVEHMQARYGTHLLFYWDEPVEFVRRVLREFVWSGQEAVLRSVGEHRRTAVPSGHDLGKSFTAARIAAWWISTRPLGQAQLVTTAPTFNQVKGILWREMARAHRRGNLPGRLNQTEWYVITPDGVEERVGLGRKPADTAPGAFQGLHERYVCVILDEADEIAPTIFEATETLITNELARMLAIGNPVNAGSEFETVCRHPDDLPDASDYVSTVGWNVIRLDGEQSPNFTGEPVPPDVSPLLLSPMWADDFALRYGRESAAYRSRVKAVWPEQRADTVVPFSWLRDRCTHMREPVEGEGEHPVPVDADELWPADELGAVELGVDVGAGGDRTVIIGRRGRRCLGVIDTVQSREPNDTTDAVVAAVHATGATSVKIDSIGWGWGVYGQLQQYVTDGERLPWDLQIVPINVAQRALDTERYYNLRSQLWWDIGRELTEQGVWDLSELPREVLLEVSEPRYELQANGRVKVEPKADTRKRLGRSPDHADALLLCYVVMPTEAVNQLLLDARVSIGAEG